MHVCVSVVPGSVNEALTLTVLPVAKTLPVTGEAIVTAGAAFATVTEKVPVAVVPAASVTVTRTVYGVERSFAYACGADRAPAAAPNVAFAPSPQSTVTVYGPTPPENEPRLNVAVAPSVELWLGPTVSATPGRLTVTVCVPVVTLPYWSVAV